MGASPETVEEHDMKGPREGRWYRTLTTEDVAWIRARISEGELTLTAIASLVGCSVPTVSLIKTGKIHNGTGRKGALKK